MTMSPFWMGFWAFAIVYFCVCLFVIARKTETAHAWLAWVPILNLGYMVHLSGRPVWWTLGLIVPVLNLVVLWLVWNGIIERRRGVPSTAGWTLLIPVLNYLVLTRLAFHDETPQASPAI